MNKESTFARIIHVDHMARTICGNWKVLIVGILICSAIFGGKNFLEQKNKLDSISAKAEITEKNVSVHTDEYYNVKSIVEYEDMIAKQQEYNENSILMKIDPVHKWGRSDRYIFKIPSNDNGDYVVDNGVIASEYLKYLTSSEMFENIANALGNICEESYLREVIIFDGSNAGNISVNVYFYNKDSVNIICEEIKNNIFLYQEEMLNVTGEHDVTIFERGAEENTDMELATKQNSNRSALISLQDTWKVRCSELNSKEIEYLELYRTARNKEDYVEGQALIKEVTENKTTNGVSKLSLIKSVLTGGILGLAVGIVLLCFKYIYSSKILNEQNFVDMYGLSILGKIEMKVHDLNSVNMIAVKLYLNLMKNDSNNVAIIGSIFGEDFDSCSILLSKALEKNGISTVIIGNIANLPEKYKILEQAQQVVLIEKLGVSEFGVIEEEVKLCIDAGRLIEGVVLID